MFLTRLEWFFIIALVSYGTCFTLKDDVSIHVAAVGRHLVEDSSWKQRLDDVEA